MGDAGGGNPNEWLPSFSYAPFGGTWRSINLGVRTSYTLTGLRNGTRYHLYLSAYSSGGRSPAAIASALLPSGTPRSYRVTGVGDGRVSLAWATPAAGIPTSGYRLSYAPFGGTWRSINLGVRTSYTLTGLRNGTRYHLYLSAYSSGGRSPAAKASAIPGGGSVTPPPNYSGNCPTAANTPGGADPWGRCWPGAHNTGVPGGVSLRTYGGPCHITTAGTVIDARIVNCHLTIDATGVVISRSR